MSQNRWARIGALFARASEEPPERWRPLLTTSGEDPEVQREVLSLLRAHRDGGRFDQIADRLRGLQPAAGSVLLANLLNRLRTALAGRYAIEQELGRGGMALVYLAHDVRHDRPVALKVLRPEVAAALGSERFLHEVRITARLNHPHILPLLDSGEAAGIVYYAMPYVEGESLRDRLARETRLPLDDALRLAREVADALSYAHGHGVVHLDVKPENILLQTGHAVVADFGIARAITAAVGDRPADRRIATGTPTYMSPEQAVGAVHLDGRSDLYSLGCVLYEMLSGEPPYTAATKQELLEKKLHDPPRRISASREAVPPAVAAALTKALARTPADRYATVREFGEALARRLPAGPSTPSPGLGRRVRRRATVLAVAGVLTIAAALALGRSLKRRAGAAERRAVAVLPFRNLSAGGPNAYLAGGLHDEVLTQLSKVAALKVIGRTSVMEYANTTKPLKQIAKELGVDAIVEASVQAVGQRLRVDVQLIDVATEAQRWAEGYDRTLDDVFAVESDIAQRVVGAVGAALERVESASIKAAPTTNGEAFLLYLQGEEYRMRPGHSRGNLESAEQLFERAVALDSTFALAWASLAQVYGAFGWYGFASRDEQARAAAETAMRLAPRTPQAHWAVGIARYETQDFVGAVPELTAAAAMLPSSAELREAVGLAQRREGRWKAALSAFEQAATLEPRDVNLLVDLGANTLTILHRYEEAIAAYGRAEALAPDFTPPALRKALGYLLWRGQLDSLRALLASGRDSSGTFPGAHGWRARLAFFERRPDSCLALLSRRRVGGGWPFAVQWYAPMVFVGWARQLGGDRQGAAAAFGEALLALDADLASHPDDSLPSNWRIHMSRGLALAGLGRRAGALREAQWLTRSVAYRDALQRPAASEARAIIFAQLGLAQEAVAELEPLLAGPSWTAAPMVRLDPRYDPIRADPRFQALLARYATPRPVPLSN